MNRFNMGNQVTNGMQILSVAGTTASSWKNQINRRNLADASSALNNMTEDEVRQVGQMRAEELRQQVRQHGNKTNGMVHLSDEEQKKFGERKAEDLRSYISGSEEESEDVSVDELVSGIETMSSPQSESLSTSIKRNSDYLKKRNLTRGEGGRFVSTKKEEKDGDK